MDSLCSFQITLCVHAEGCGARGFTAWISLGENLRPALILPLGAASAPDAGTGNQTAPGAGSRAADGSVRKRYRNPEGHWSPLRVTPTGRRRSHLPLARM